MFENQATPADYGIDEDHEMFEGLLLEEVIATGIDPEIWLAASKDFVGAAVEEPEGVTFPGYRQQDEIMVRHGIEITETHRNLLRKCGKWTYGF